MGEPQLKCTELAADAADVLSQTKASAFAASDKVLLLGCFDGRVVVLDVEGNQVRTEHV